MSVIKDVIATVKQRDPNQPEFHQAVEEVMETLEPTVKKHPEFVKANINRLAKALCPVKAAPHQQWQARLTKLCH